MDIGARIRQLRTKNNLTLEELASRCELTKGYLSQLENNAASPSVATLMDVTEALGTNMSAFFREESREPVTFSADDFFVDEKDGATTTWVIPNAQKNAMEPIILDLAPGRSSEEIVPHEGEEFGYVLSGRVTLVSEAHELTVKKGETFYLKGEHAHQLRNDSNYHASVLWICTPPIF